MCLSCCGADTVQYGSPPPFQSLFPVPNLKGSTVLSSENRPSSIVESAGLLVSSLQFRSHLAMMYAIQTGMLNNFLSKSAEAAFKGVYNDDPEGSGEIPGSGVLFFGGAMSDSVGTIDERFFFSGQVGGVKIFDGDSLNVNLSLFSSSPVESDILSNAEWAKAESNGIIVGALSSQPLSELFSSHRLKDAELPEGCNAWLILSQIHRGMPCVPTIAGVRLSWNGTFASCPRIDNITTSGPVHQVIARNPVSTIVEPSVSSVVKAFSELQEDILPYVIPWSKVRYGTGDLVAYQTLAVEDRPQENSKKPVGYEHINCVFAQVIESKEGLGVGEAIARINNKYSVIKILPKFDTEKTISITSERCAEKISGQNEVFHLHWRRDATETPEEILSSLVAL